MKYIIILLSTFLIAFNSISQTQFHSDTMKCERYISEDSLRALRKAYDKKVTILNDNGDTVGYKMCEMFNPGIISRCQYKIKEGYNKIFYETGTIEHEGVYGNKIRKWKRIENGYFIYYYENGNKKVEGAYINGKKEGLWKEYNEDGFLESEDIYSNDFREGPSILYYDNGAIQAKGQWTVNKKHTRLLFRPFSRKRSKKYGIWTYNDRKGNMLDSINWTSDNKSDLWEKEYKLLKNK